MNKDNRKQRVMFAVDLLQKHGVEYVVKSPAQGHLHCRRKSDDALVQYWAGTGSIVVNGSPVEQKGIHQLLKIVDDMGATR